MKKILASGVVIVSSVFVVAVLSACSADTDAEESRSTTSAVLEGPGIWQLRRECGTKETGACSKTIAPCDGDGIGGACPDAGELCIGAPNASGLRQVLFCNPTSSSTWTYNGDCADQSCGGRPACAATDREGERCHYPLKRCARNGRVLVCLTNGKTQYAFSGYCGQSGGAACVTFPACTRDEDGMAGLSCADEGSACRIKTGTLTGKVFTCVTR